MLITAACSATACASWNSTSCKSRTQDCASESPRNASTKHEVLAAPVRFAIRRRPLDSIVARGCCCWYSRSPVLYEHQFTRIGVRMYRSTISTEFVLIESDKHLSLLYPAFAFQSKIDRVFFDVQSAPMQSRCTLYPSVCVHYRTCRWYEHFTSCALFCTIS